MELVQKLALKYLNHNV